MQTIHSLDNVGDRRTVTVPRPTIDNKTRTMWACVIRRRQHAGAVEQRIRYFVDAADAEVGWAISAGTLREGGLDAEGFRSRYQR